MTEPVGEEPYRFFTDRSELEMDNVPAQKEIS